MTVHLGIRRFVANQKLRLQRAGNFRCDRIDAALRIGRQVRVAAGSAGQFIESVFIFRYLIAWRAAIGGSPVIGDHHGIDLHRLFDGKG